MLVTAVALRALLLSGGAYSSRLVVPVQPAGTCAWSQPPSTSSRVVTRHAPPECSLLNRNSDAVVPPLDEHPQRKVALLVEPTPFTHISGYSNRFKEMLRHLKDGGDQSAVITPDDSPDRPNDFLGIPITYIPGFRLFCYRQVMLTFDVGLKAWARLRSFRPDLIHVATPGFFVLPAILYSRLLNVPLVISYHTHLPAYADRYVTVPGFRQLAIAFANTMLPAILNWADVILATSPQIQGELKQIGCQRVDVWQKGIDTEVFSPKFNASNEETRSMLTGGEPHKPLLLHVGRLGAEKNIKLLRDVLERMPHARLAVVGSGPAEEDLREYFKGTPTVFTGMMRGEALSRCYAAADVFVMPSESETLGFVVLESMASGVPAVAARAGGIPNLIRDGETSILFDPGDADDMVAKINSLLNDNEKRAAMGEAARSETLRWNWRSATSVLRNVQYKIAETNFEARQASWMNRALRSVNPFRYFNDDDDSGNPPGLNGTAPVVDSV